MDVTPKKLVSSEIKCFICSVLIEGNKRIRVFKTGISSSSHSSHDVEGLICRTLDVNISVYRNSDAFICIKCYKTLIKFKKAETNVQEIKNELRNLYKERDCTEQRVKRLVKDVPLVSFAVPSSKKQLFSSTTSTSLSSSFQLENQLPIVDCIDDQSMF